MYCLRCKQVIAAFGEHEHRTVRRPSDKAMTRWMFDGVAKTPDGCKTEPDGSCSHGHNSWLIVLGLI